MKVTFKDTPKWKKDSTEWTADKMYEEMSKKELIAHFRRRFGIILMCGCLILFFGIMGIMGQVYSHYQIVQDLAEDYVDLRTNYGTALCEDAELGLYHGDKLSKKTNILVVNCLKGNLAYRIGG